MFTLIITMATVDNDEDAVEQQLVEECSRIYLHPTTWKFSTISVYILYICNELAIEKEDIHHHEEGSVNRKTGCTNHTVLGNCSRLLNNRSPIWCFKVCSLYRNKEVCTERLLSKYIKMPTGAALRWLLRVSEETLALCSVLVLQTVHILPSFHHRNVLRTITIDIPSWCS